MIDAVSHVADATVVHKSPFASLEVPVILGDPPAKLISRWIKPLYMSFLEPDSEPIIAELWPEMDYGSTLTLLSYHNWRPRIVGAYIVAARKIHELTELIGKLLLRSDVCYAGRGYCLALARLNTPLSRQYLHQYLDYYLTRNDLWFDQSEAMGAIAYLDSVNGTKELSQFVARWDAFIQNKPQWNLARSSATFSQQMLHLEQIAQKNAISP